MSKRASFQREPLGWQVHKLVRGKGDDPAQDFIEFLRRDASPETEPLVRALVEAATERDTHTGKLLAIPRHLNHPVSRRVLATWAIVAQYCRGHVANSRALWQGHRHAGRAGGIGGRLGGVAADTVRRYLNMLQASGALKRWQPPGHTKGVVRQLAENGEGRCYAMYLVRVLPRALVRAVRSHYERAKREAPPPEALQRSSVAAPAPAPSRAAPTPRAAAAPRVPDERIRGYAPPDAVAKLIPT